MIVRGLQSLRSATIESTVVARLAGIHVATAAIVQSTAGASRNVEGSYTPTPKRNPESPRAPATESSNPIAHPVATIVSPCRRISAHRGPAYSERHADSQLTCALRQAESGTPVADVSRQLGVSELRRLRQVEDDMTV